MGQGEEMHRDHHHHHNIHDHDDCTGDDYHKHGAAYHYHKPTYHHHHGPGDNDILDHEHNGATNNHEHIVLDYNIYTTNFYDYQRIHDYGPADHNHNPGDDNYSPHPS